MPTTKRNEVVTGEKKSVANGTAGAGAYACGGRRHKKSLREQVLDGSRRVKD